MRVREATPEDRSAWDSFVDSQGGAFSLYFDWKYAHEAGGARFIPLLAEAAPSRLVGILPIVKEDHFLYSTLDSGRGGGAQGLLLKRDLTDDERNEATSGLLDYVAARCSRRCSSFKLVEAPAPDRRLSEEPTPALINRGFGFKYDKATHLPCNFILPLTQPFQQAMWRKWPRRLRQYIDGAARRGVVVVQDREFKYADDFRVMLSENDQRHGLRPLTRDEIMVRLDVFREKTKLFVALLDGKPVVALLCHFTPTTCYLARVGAYEKDTNDANKLCWKAVIEDACNAGLRFADFGYTDTQSLAYFKERFRATRVPVRVYERRYSILGTIMQKGPARFNRAWHNRGYIWSNRRRLLSKVVHS